MIQPPASAASARTARFGRPHLTAPFEGPARRVRGYFNRHGPGLTLWVLSPVIAELVLGSSPPLVFLLFGWIDLLMYGGGAVIVRELVRRWGKGWPSVLALGVAYGIFEEGLALRSFFNPDWPGSTGLGSYGWVGPTNWFWDVEMGLYHSVVSITLPILLVTMANRSRSDEAWIPGGSLRRVVLGFLATVPICWVIAPYSPGAGPILACVAAMAACVVIARVLPARVAWAGVRPCVGVLPGGPAPDRFAPSPRRVYRLCLAATTLAFAVVMTRGFGLPFAAGAASLVAIVVAVALWVLRGSAAIGWDDRHRFAVAAGAISFFVGWSPLIELTGGRGEVIVGIVTGVVLRRVWLALNREPAANP
jgi:hypothetical protein